MDLTGVAFALVAGLLGWRYLALLERRAAPAVPAPVADPEAVAKRLAELEARLRLQREDPIPLPMYAAAMRWDDAWARDSALEALWEQRQRLGGWDKVGTVTGLAEPAGTL